MQDKTHQFLLNMNTKKIANLNVLAIANARTISLHHLIELLFQEGQI